MSDGDLHEGWKLGVQAEAARWREALRDSPDLEQIQKRVDDLHGVILEPYDGDRFIPYEENPERHTYTTGAIKDNRSKARVDLLPSGPLVEIARVLTYGAKKYKPHNWRLGLPWGDTYASMQRHLVAWNDREDIDPESGLRHLAHAGCQLLFLLEYELRRTGVDDRWNQATACKSKMPGNMSEPAAAAENAMGCPDCGMPWSDHAR